ncbi:hypothetical protein TIFTF001_014102 [Ficus carica]|uniref:Uncharacterized protein n=1 Tax=Ficus carica TaxID=3494 RepID=A0AA88D3Q0_FICCA|nr:hypothetical protein TIFTF001_014102 [Ficus carica]
MANSSFSNSSHYCKPDRARYVAYGGGCHPLPPPRFSRGLWHRCFGGGVFRRREMPLPWGTGNGLANGLPSVAQILRNKGHYSPVTTTGGKVVVGCSPSRLLDYFLE